jgi:hypothetical protein
MRFIDIESSSTNLTSFSSHSSLSTREGDPFTVIVGKKLLGSGT